MLNKKLSHYYFSMQQQLFPIFEQEQFPTTDQHRKIIIALDMIEIERFLPQYCVSGVGRPLKDRDALARSFVAKAVLNLPTTLGLIDRIKVDSVLRRICGFSGKLPCEATFSNAFADFANSGLAEKAHEQLVTNTYGGRVVLHVSRDSTSIDGRQKPKKKPKKKKTTKKRGRPKKGELRAPKAPNNLERHLNMSAEEIIKELPSDCDVGGKKNSKGHTSWWIGHKLHCDVDDYGIPLSVIVTSASVHDSQAAIALEKMSNNRVASLYTLMDSAYKSKFIESAVEDAGKVSIIDPKKPRGGEKIPLDPAKKHRYKVRTTVERTNATLKDDFGARFIRVQGHKKVLSHLMFGVVAMSALRIVETFL